MARELRTPRLRPPRRRLRVAQLAFPRRPVVVMPTYNEAGTVLPLARAVRRIVPHADLLIVDDDSPDGTGQIAAHLSERDEAVRVLHRRSKEGLGRAYVDAFMRLVDEDYDAVVQMDADGSHDPQVVPQLLAELAGGADLVLGSRYVSGGSVVGWSTGRRVLSRCGSWYSRAILRGGVHDWTTGFRAWRTSALKRMPLQNVRSRGYGFQVEMTERAARSGCRIAEVPITFEDRTEGDSKMTAEIAWEAFKLCWWLRWRLR